jgi:hypothetical protein
MSNLRRFAVIEACVLIALVAASAAMGTIGGLDALRVDSSMVSPRDSAALLFAYTVTIGLMPALLLGGPAYFSLLYLRKASWLSVIITGAVPGLSLFAFEASIAPWAALGGVLVATFTHGLYRAWINRANYKAEGERAA